jgi:hypothetical protein
MSGQRKTARLVLRLDSFGASTPALRAIARLAGAMEAEFAARLVEDRRLAGAMAFNAQSAAPLVTVHHIERSLRRRIEEVAARADAAWSFAVAECSGVFAAECTLHADDLLAIALPEIEPMMGLLREEISGALARAAGVLLMPRTPPPPNRPVVGVITHPSGLSQVVEMATQLATRLHLPLSFVVVDDGDLVERVHAQAAAQWNGPLKLHISPKSQLENLAAFVRSLRPKQVVAAPRPSTIQEFLRRPRLLREMSAAVLLLPAGED